MRKIVMLLAVLVLASMSAAAATNTSAMNHGSPPAVVETNTFDITITMPSHHLATINAEVVSNADTRSANASQNWVADVAVRNQQMNPVDTPAVIDRSPETVPLLMRSARKSGADRTIQTNPGFAQAHLTAKHAAGQLDIDQHDFARSKEAATDFNLIFADSNTRTRAPAELDLNSMPPYFSAV